MVGLLWMGHNQTLLKDVKVVSCTIHCGAYSAVLIKSRANTCLPCSSEDMTWTVCNRHWARFIKHLHPFYTHILILQAFPTISTEEVRFINVILTVDYSGDPSANTEKNMKKIKSFEIYTAFNHFIYTIFTIWLMNRAQLCHVAMCCELIDQLFPVNVPLQNRDAGIHVVKCQVWSYFQSVMKGGMMFYVRFPHDILYL